ncbi:hypothetical protein [Burkholderia paludis]|uniref:hypothetical protein n=1 Tax=Burkholderia paludis TaxID=1506587 RepID=UPI001269AAD3|nr:hypothetical protein [Burkholderia paludis]
MKQPERLSLKKAINATKRRLNRPGDLAYVIFFPSAIGPITLPGRFMPNQLDDSVRQFRQPETERYLRDDLYANGGWLESAAHLSDREIALLGDGWGGRILPSGLVGSWGNPTDLEEDLQIAYALIPAGFTELPVSPVVLTIIREVVLMLHKKYAPDADIGRAQSDAQSKRGSKGRRAKNNSGGTLADVIRILSREHPDSRPSEIWPHLKQAIQEWSGGDVAEIEGSGDSRSYRYVPPNAESEDAVRPISYGQFRKELRKSRGGKNGN